VEIGIGRMITISVSKIKNINIMKKNRMEKELRNIFLVSNPHSKELIFSRKKIVLVDNTRVRSKNNLIKKAKKTIRALNITIRFLSRI